jgi:hypothetical protein
VRRLVGAAGVAPAVLALLDGDARALPRGEETDAAVLDAALVLEHEAIYLYDLALRRNLFPPGLKRYALEFVGDHKGHRDTQVAIAEERGFRVQPARAEYEVGELRNSDQAIRRCLEIEITAQKAYTGVIGSIRTRDYLLSAAFILVDEVRHMTVWQRVLGLKIY